MTGDIGRAPKARTKSAESNRGKLYSNKSATLARDTKARPAPTMEDQGQRHKAEPCVSFGFNARSPFREHAHRLGDGTAIEVGTVAKIPSRRHSTLSVLPDMRRHGMHHTVNGL